jgi:glutamate racemase
MSTQNPIIGVFDSGFGGLTVLRALLPLIPAARYIYLGDTARLPYGSKSQETIARYAVSSARFLLDQGADLLVIACNTASALALDDIKQAIPIPVVGVIQPGAQAAAQAQTQSNTTAILSPSNNAVILSAAKDPERFPTATVVAPFPPQIDRPGLSTASQVLVLATTATVHSRAYTRELNALGLRATEKACPLLVPLVEEGWVDHPVTAEVLRIYLTEALAEAPNATTLVLGCTHYPLLKPLIERTLATLRHPLQIIDAAQATAEATAALIPPTTTFATATCTFYATDSTEKFQLLGSNFLGQPLPEVKLLDLGG